MGSQFIGLILLVLAVAGGLYGITNHSNLLKLKLDLPAFKPVINFQAAPISSGVSSSITSSPVVENKKPVRIISVRTASGINQSTEVSLSANLTSAESADITGWTIQSNKSSFIIPQAQEVYSFGGNQQNIQLRSGDRANLYSGAGPKGNFRLNKCMGYIEELISFSPSLPKNCPYISRSETVSFSGACQNYITSLRACENPAANPPVPIDDGACHDFLRKLNYVGCVEKHQNDSDFLQNEWRIWLGNQINIFDPLHDKVQLLDRSGKVVDEYTY